MLNHYCWLSEVILLKWFYMNHLALEDNKHQSGTAEKNDNFGMQGLAPTSPNY